MYSPAAAQDQPARYINGPLTPAAVDHKGSITAIIYPDDTVLGEPGIVVNKLSENEFPSKLFTILAGRPNQFGDVYWDGYLDSFYLHIYSADPITGYLSGAAPLAIIKLKTPVDLNGNPINAIADTLSPSYLPNIPTYAVVSSNPDYKQHRGYYAAFNLTNDPASENETTTYIPEELSSLIQSEDFVVTFYVNSFSATNGGVRVTVQESGLGQTGPLSQSVFSSFNQAPFYPSDPSQYSYSIGFEIDGCANDPLKLSEGICGCGIADDDNDSDGALNCEEECFEDPLKNSAGQCGCGLPDTDTDADNTADCNDSCASDPLKTDPGVCGCNVIDQDSDGDLSFDCQDECINDPLKISAGICGCNISDADLDNDLTPDCQDECPGDPNKTEQGQCGCNITDTDSDNDGIADCLDIEEPKKCLRLKKVYERLKHKCSKKLLKWLEKILRKKGCSI